MAAASSDGQVPCAVDLVIAEPPPAYAPSSTTGESQCVFQPPAYEIATKLPSYEEAEKSKAAEAGVPLAQCEECPERAAREARRAARSWPFRFWTAPSFLLAEAQAPIHPSTLTHAQLKQQILGTELEFLCCFLITFLFNWIGLFAALCCLTVTIAGRAGAISGFGLSVVKWAFLVMHQSYVTRKTLGLVTSTDATAFMTDAEGDGSLTDNKWFVVSCWLIVGLGILCFLQGIVHYARAKKCALDQNWLRQQLNRQPF